MFWASLVLSGLVPVIYGIRLCFFLQCKLVATREFFLRGRNEDLSSTDSSLGQMDIQRCPFLRNINEPTNFSFSTPISFPLPVRGAKGPIFEDGPNFDMAFRLFHGRDGVVPLSGKQFSHPEVESSPQFNPLAAKAATISLSAFGPGGPFSFDAFSDKWKKQKKKPSKESSSQGSGSSHEAMSNEWLQTGNCPIAKSYRAVSSVLPLVAKALQPPAGMKFRCPPAVAATISLSAFGPGGPFSFDAFSDKWKKQKKKPSKESSSQGSGSSHEAMSNEWLQTGNCPIAKSYRAVSSVLPLVAKALQPPAGMKFRCPPAVVAARAALARTALVKNLRPQPLHSKMLVIAMLGMAANVPLGIWREHTKKFSPSWFVAVHAAVPFIAMLRKSVLMPKTAMAFTVAASILGQVIGSRAERHRLRALPQAGETTKQAEAVDGGNQLSSPPGEMVVGITNSGHCGEAEWNAAPLKASTGSSSTAANMCY
ncbi:hypothetical protein H6P81_005776 [Aristolochia fimbriata]|uniref:Uncharacterized protein n=1 Tax=Aristolochia fimbriata TaxID=158543 RepID=A0AAV7EVI9_ARIFI|nr:hypothetical protein H6P81_005776 [Aristolochia fimbriata]